MQESNDTVLDELPLALIRQIDAIARRAERLSRGGDTIRIEDYLREVPPVAQHALFEELLGLELEQQLKRGEAITREAWLSRFPDHSVVIDRVLKELRGEKPAVGSPKSEQNPFFVSRPNENAHRFPSIPGYRIERQLGRGSMGVVYLAQQERLKRLVAVKVVAAGFDLPQAAAIVRAEAAVIARLKHPNIVQVYEIGEDDGEPFLAIEYVDGESLRERLLKDTLPQRQAIELIEQLARAIHHAHTNGVVHRDLKPANILLLDSGPHLVPKISDFGLAKVLDAMNDQTRTGMVLGTPKYMAPEQAEGRTSEIGPATDVYALGAILFELLVGRAPFENSSSLKLMQSISLQEVRFPLTAHQSVSADLQAICLKCLEKDPNRRYASALELADDIRRYLNDFPVVARRPTRVDLISKFIRRNPALSASIAIAFATLIAASIGIGTFAIRESQAREQAELLAKKESEARSSVEALRVNERRNVYWANLHLAQKAWRGNRLDHMRQHLEHVSPDGTDEDDLRGFEWHYLWRLSDPKSLILADHFDESRVSFSPDGRHLASPNKQGEIRMFDSVSGEIVFSLPGHEGVRDVVFSTDGKKLAACGGDFKVHVWDLDTREKLHVLEGHSHIIRTIAFSPDGRQLVSGDETEKIVAWNVKSGTTEWQLDRAHVMDIDYDPKGEQIAVGCGFGGLLIVSATDGQIKQQIDAHTRWLSGVAFSPDGQQVATSSEDHSTKIWTLSNPQDPIELRSTDVLTSVAFSADGQTIGTSSHDGTARLWDATTGRPIVDLVGHSNWVHGVAFSKDGLVASASADRTVRIWKPNLDWEVRTLATMTSKVNGLCFTPEGDRLAAICDNSQVELRDVATGKVVSSFLAQDSNPWRTALSPDGSKLATSNVTGTIRLWDPVTGKELGDMQGHTDRVNCLVFVPNSNLLLSASHDRTIRVWDTVTGEQIHMIQRDSSQFALACSPDGRLLASSGSANVEIWDTSDWANLATLTGATGHTHTVLCLTFSSNGRLLASGGFDWNICVWDVNSGDQLNRIKGHSNAVTCVKFSQDGRRLISGSQDGTVRFWEPESGRELLTLENHSDWVNSIALDPSERILASASNDGTVKLIELDGPNYKASSVTSVTDETSQTLGH